MRAGSAALVLGAVLAVGAAYLLLRERDEAPAPSRSVLDDTAAPRSMGVELPASPAPRAAPPPTKAPPGPIAPHIAGLVVRRSDGTALADAHVVLRLADEAASPRELTATTAADGHFDLPLGGLPRDATLVVTWKPVTRWLELGDETEQELSRDPATANFALKALDFTTGTERRVELETGWMIGGTVSDGRGHAVHGARLVAEQTGNAAESGRQGEFRLRDVDPRRGRVTLVASAPGRAEQRLEVDEPAPGEVAAHAQITLLAPFTLSGTVSFENRAVARQVEVTCIGQDAVGPGPFTTHTQDDGSFRLEGLPAGAFDLVVRVADDEARFAACPDAAAETWVRGLRLPGAPPELQIVVARGQSLTGFVLADFGRPLDGHLVVARAVRPMPCDPGLWAPTASIEVEGNGRFTLRRLEPGDWQLSVEGAPEGCDHGDGFHWRPLGTGNTFAALAQDGPRPGSPRPVELVQDAELSATSPPVTLTVRRPGDVKSAGTSWPSLQATFTHGPGPPQLRHLEYAATFEVIDGGLVRARGRSLYGSFIDIKLDDSSAAGLVRVTSYGLLPIVRELHDAQLDGNLGVLPAEPATPLAIRVREAGGAGAPAGLSLAAHWIDGGLDEGVVFRDDAGQYEMLYADRREGRWVLTIDAPGFRRHREQGVLGGTGAMQSVDVELQRW